MKTPADPSARAKRAGYVLPRVRGVVCVAGGAVLVLVGCALGHHERIFRMPASSMEPTLHCGRPAPGCLGARDDRLVTHPYGGHSPARGDIVVFRVPDLARTACGISGLFVKRVVGLPGDVWAERAGYVYIDGGKLAEPYVDGARHDTQSLTMADIPPRGKLKRIPADEYLVLGDNRAFSCDSRVWGLVPHANLIGKVVEIRRGSKRIRLR